LIEIRGHKATIQLMAIVTEADSGDVFGETADWLRYISVAETVGVARDEGTVGESELL
jgi:hypothetical protein